MAAGIPLVPAALILALFARQLLGDPASHIPDQGAMVAWLLFSIVWALLSAVIMIVIHTVFRIAQPLAIAVSITCWLLSIFLLFIIGPL